MHLVYPAQLGELEPSYELLQKSGCGKAVANVRKYYHGGQVKHSDRDVASAASNLRASWMKAVKGTESVAPTEAPPSSSQSQTSSHPRVRSEQHPASSSSSMSSKKHHAAEHVSEETGGNLKRERKGRDDEIRGGSGASSGAGSGSGTGTGEKAEGGRHGDAKDEEKVPSKTERAVSEETATASDEATKPKGEKGTTAPLKVDDNGYKIEKESSVAEAMPEVRVQM